jgi:hypothetical protein
MKRYNYDYDEDGEIYSMTDPITAVVKNIRPGLSKYAAVRGGLFRIPEKGVELKLMGSSLKSIGKNSQTITVFQDGSSK